MENRRGCGIENIIGGLRSCNPEILKVVDVSST